MRWLILCYALLGLLWFGYLGEWRVAALWLVLMLLARSSLQMRRALRGSPSAWRAWRDYARQSRDHLVVTGWKVLVFFVGAGLIQTATIGFDHETLQGLYAQSRSFSDLIWWLSPLVHSSLSHWLGNTVAAMLVMTAFHRIRCEWMIAWGVGAALSVSLLSVAFSWLTEMEHAVVGSSAGIAGMIGAGGFGGKRSRITYPPGFHHVLNIQFFTGFVVLSLMVEPKSALVHIIGWLTGLGLAMVCQPKP